MPILRPGNRNGEFTGRPTDRVRCADPSPAAENGAALGPSLADCLRGVAAALRDVSGVEQQEATQGAAMTDRQAIWIGFLIWITAWGALLVLVLAYVRGRL